MSENYLLFSDESGYNGKHRFRSIAIISGPKSILKKLNEELQTILTKYRCSEIKFSKITGHINTKIIAVEFLHLALSYCNLLKIKVHVITWDIKDSRHKIKGRKDIENLKRMYYHILKRAQNNWGEIINWEFYPDEFSAINWQSEVIPYLSNTNLEKKDNDDNTLFAILKNTRFPLIYKHNELESDNYPILQLADLFAGMIRYSHEHGKLFNQWLSDIESEDTLFPIKKSCNASKNAKHKFYVMKDFKETCKKYKLGVNFSENKYFTTFSNKNGIILWLYKPQGEYDKAPTSF